MADHWDQMTIAEKLDALREQIAEMLDDVRSDLDQTPVHHDGNVQGCDDFEIPMTAPKEMIAANLKRPQHICRQRRTIAH
jgi:hypothetical protein